MPSSSRDKLTEKVRLALEHKPRQKALYDAVSRTRASRARTLADLPNRDSFQREVRETKLRCLGKWDELLEKFSAKVRERGSKVFHAKDGAEAIAYVLQVAKTVESPRVAKSKSLTTEEIEINQVLEAENIPVVETDLGELIIQLVHEKPFHLVFPAIHKTAEEVSDIFSKEIKEEVPRDVPGIMKVVRKYLRPIFLNANIGMTGANVGVAENGAIVIETNEGNARMVTSLPKIHICIMGMEKIVETVEDALKMTLAHPVSATGQMLTTYVTWLAGRPKPAESHIIILDNGRSKMREDPVMSDALNCIRCGACMNICPTYGVVGGHTFGHIYPGPIGIPWTAEVHGQDNAAEFAPLCISCGLCKEICPAQIDMPMMIAEVKDRSRKEHPPPFVDRAMMGAESFAKLASATAPVSNWFLRFGWLRWLMGLDRGRTFPPFRRKTFFKQWAKRSTKTGGRKVAYFVDLYVNHNAPELGMKAVEALEKRGCEVLVPPQRSSGYPYIAYGDLDKARKVAAYNVEQLRGMDVVATEPTAAYALKHLYPKLLGSQAARDVAKRTFEFFEFLLMLGADDPPLRGKYGFHISCHQRPLGSGSHAMEWLRKRGAEVRAIENGTCCGMGGTFGMKAGPLGRDLSDAVGAPLFELFRKADVDVIVTESSVCRMHLGDGTGLTMRHPLEVVDGKT